MSNTKTIDWSSVKHFKPGEFACPCCGKLVVNPRLVAFLDKARVLAGVPFLITSGYRCPAHNVDVGGEPGSSHLGGWAVDIACSNNVTRGKILGALIKAGFRRLGIAKTFIHADVDPNKPNCVWLYGGRK